MRRGLISLGLAGLLAFAAVHPASAQDLNGDGFVDAVFTAKQTYNQVCYGDGTGTFSDCRDIKGAGQFPMLNTFNTTASALGDWDADGDLDIIFAINNSQSRVCLNDGGSFNTGTGCPELWGQVFDTEDVAAGDIDGDGSLDVVFANGGEGVDQTNVVCFWGSNGGCAYIGSELARTTGVALGDVDGDGRLDFLFSNAGSSNTVCLYRGRSSAADVNVDCRAIPTFGAGQDFFFNWATGQNVPLQWAKTSSNAVAVGNLPPAYGVAPDGFLDVVFANTGKNELCFNTGDWTGPGAGFACEAQRMASSYTQYDSTAISTDVVVADTMPGIAGDEVFFANADAANTRCYGRFFCGFAFSLSETVEIVSPIFGTFTASEPVADPSAGLALADIVGYVSGVAVDGPDGKVDFVVANTDGASRVFRGLGNALYSSSLFVEIATRAGVAGAPTSVALGDFGASPVVNENPAQQVASLSATIAGLGIGTREIQVLTNTLDQLAASIARGNLDSANGQIGAFINQVEARVRSRRISQPDGASLVLAAQNIRAALNQ